VRAPDAPVHSETERFVELTRMAEYMGRLWTERAAQPPRFDLLSMLAHGQATRDMPPREFMGTLGLLIVGGNDTTRNTMSGGLLALHRHPDQWAKLRANPALLPGLVQETIRWQTPVIHMRRTARVDAELGGQRIRAGDKVVMWYVSGNRDAEVIDDPEGFVIDRPRPRHHLSFGSGIHRCVGDRLAELQLHVLWEEILRRDLRIEVVGEPVRAYSNFLRGIKSLPVRIAA
jgi:cytochrome P450